MATRNLDSGLPPVPHLGDTPEESAGKVLAHDYPPGKAVRALNDARGRTESGASYYHDGRRLSVGYFQGQRRRGFCTFSFLGLSRRRYLHKELQLRSSRAEAEADLEAFAKKRGLVES